MTGQFDIRAEMDGKIETELRKWKAKTLYGCFQGEAFEYISSEDKLRHMYKHIKLHGSYPDIDGKDISLEKFNMAMDALNNFLLMPRSPYIFSLLWGQYQERVFAEFLIEKGLDAYVPDEPMPLHRLRGCQKDIAVRTSEGEAYIELKALSSSSALVNDKGAVWAFLVGCSAKWMRKEFPVAALVIYLVDEKRYIWTMATEEAQQKWKNVWDNKAVPVELWQDIDSLLSALKML